MSTLTALTAGTWNVDPSHSAVSFVARHLMVSKVRGSFNVYGGTITIAEDPLASKVEATVDAASIDTGDDNRDGHLRGGDFFDVEQYPTWSLASTSLTPKGGDTYTLAADLTIKGVTKPVTFDLEFDGVATDPWGNTKAGFSAETEISRKEFGLEWNVALETGGVLVGDKVKIQLDIQAVKA
ncbi:MAG: YceI family protein [Acidimicrobiales bacterium]|nr:YceI family protein [Acidimicrobiales bacterium]